MLILHPLLSHYFHWVIVSLQCANNILIPIIWFVNLIIIVLKVHLYHFSFLGSLFNLPCSFSFSSSMVTLSSTEKGLILLYLGLCLGLWFQFASFYSFEFFFISTLFCNHWSSLFALLFIGFCLIFSTSLLANFSPMSKAFTYIATNKPLSILYF